MLSERPLKEDNIENPQAAPPENLHGSLEASTGGDSSDGEQERDFDPAVVSQQDKPHVHWCDQLERSDQDRLVEQNEHRPTHSTEKEKVLRHEKERKETDAGKLHTAVQEQRDPPKDQSLEEATAKIKECSLSKVIPNTCTEAEDTLTSAAATGPEPSPESKHGSSTTLTAGLSITQVGMSRRGADCLRDLLRNHPGESKPDSVRLNLLECLRRTLKEWCTEETLQFLYGDDHSPVSSFVDVKEEELDEDDLDDDVTVAGELKRPSAAAPDYESLRRRTEELELRVREFYKGTWVLPVEEQELNGNKVSGGERVNTGELIRFKHLRLLSGHC